MASKQKIKKKKRAPEVIGGSTDSGKARSLIENEELASAVDENTKDSGREKQRSDTPSPPPAISSPSKKNRIPSPHSTQKRASSPFSNKVEPLPSGSKDLSNPGSVVSLHSNTSVKEAWTDNEEDKKRPVSANSHVSKSSNKVSQKPGGSTQIDTISIKSTSQEQQAYIPYLYAKGCIARITDDMKAMKLNHIRIVHDIEAHYRSLEGESQKQFMAFVMKYREKFDGRLQSFHHVIGHYHEEMSAKDENAKQEIESLKENNNKLLQEKNEALTQAKDEIDKMEADKVALTSQIAVGGAGAAELARITAENEALRDENSQLRAQGSSSTTTVTKQSIPVVAAVPIPVGDGEDEEERKKWKEHVLKLQEEVAQLKVENGHLTATSDAYKQQLSQSADLAARFAELENQYKALSVVVVPSAETKMAAEEQLSKTKEDKVMMEAEQKRLDKDVKDWEKKFVKENGRQPDEADKSDSVKELYVQQAEVTQMVTSLDQQKDTLTQLTSGTVKPPPDAGAAVNAVATPEVQVVEVTVPDPEIVNQLEASQNEVEELKSQIVLLSATGGAAASMADDEKVDQSELDAANAALLQEQAAHDNTKTELENVQKQLEMLNDTLRTERAEIESKMEAYKNTLEAKIASRDEQMANLKSRNEELEEERLKNVPLDTAKEIKNLQNKIAVLEQEKSTLALAQAGETTKISDLTRKLELSEEALQKEKEKQKQLEERLKVVKKEKEDAVRDLTKLLSSKAPGRPTRQKTQMGDTPAGRGDVASLKRENQELNARIKQLERESMAGIAVGAAGAGGDKKTQLRHEKILKELEKRYDMEKNKNAKLSESLKEKESEASSLQKSNNQKEAEVARLTAELAALGVAAKEGVAAASKLKELEKDNKKFVEENKVLTENFNSERVLRKKYYNMVEDMKGKIRVYCRARPLSGSELDRGNYSVLKSMDEYTLSVTSQRGIKEFQYDQVFMESSSQEQVFADTNNLIQSAIDGYNVCIFAYGQTGSGKTFTMIGDSSKKFPGIAPRAFNRIFEMADENKSKIDMSVSVYMMELYNDKLIDLFAKGGYADEDKMEIKKDKKGMVMVQGAIIKTASNAKELNALFEEGSANRHTASTKMNAESSRSHLILSIVMESTNKTTGTVMKGKLSLVDLAGSERVGKTGASAEQLKEAMSINKSLSALGDVISALSSEQSFIPYRNNKLTMLMQDSLGGNAKTLMFVNISPADYNVDETVISLTYASRVKLITNDASKNADNKEISRLKNIIAKMKKGEAVEEEAE